MSYSEKILTMSNSELKEAIRYCFDLLFAELDCGDYGSAKQRAKSEMISELHSMMYYPTAKTKERLRDFWESLESRLSPWRVAAPRKEDRQSLTAGLFGY